nr:hypothetical protein [Gayadomonas joobiniege]
MPEQLLHIHESIVSDGWPIAIKNSPNNFSYIQCCYLIYFKLPNYRLDLFGVNTLWNVWVLEPVFKIMLKPVFKQVIDGLNTGPLATLSFCQWIDALLDELTLLEGGITCVSQGKLLTI